jgi:hypothetical protein
VDLWDTVEYLREGLGAWLAYPDVDVQKRAAEMLMLIEDTLERVVQRRTATPQRSVAVVAPELRRHSRSAVPLDLAEEE